MLRKISYQINALNEWAGRGVAWLTALLMLLVFMDVLLRKMLNFTTVWMPELEWHLFGLIFLLGAGYSLKHGRHVRVDLFFDNFSRRDQALVDFWGTLLFLLPWCSVAMYYCWGYAMESWQLNESSPQPGGLPALYFIKFSIVAGFALLFLQGIATLIRAALETFGKRKEEG